MARNRTKTRTQKEHGQRIDREVAPPALNGVKDDQIGASEVEGSKSGGNGIDNVTVESSEKYRLEIERERLRLEKTRLENENRFWNKYTGTIITSIISLAAVLVSYNQVRVASLSKEKEIEIAVAQKQKEYEMAQLQQNREWNLNMAKFVSEHADVIFGGNEEQRKRIRDVIIATFPANISSILFQKLEATASSPQARSTWREAQKALPAFTELIPSYPSAPGNAPLVLQTENVNTHLVLSTTPLPQSTRLSTATSMPLSEGIIVDSPRLYGQVQSPLEVKGKARGTWFFEGDFPVSLLDENGKELASGPAKAQGNWGTDDFVPFRLQLAFTAPKTKKGLLVFEYPSPKDGEVLRQYKMPIYFLQ